MSIKTEEEYSRYKISCNKSNNNAEKVDVAPRITMNQLKLAVAMELRYEGYNKIVFDKIIEVNNRKIQIHVYCEDELESRVAVYCVNRADRIRPNDIMDIVDLIGRGVEDCDVAIAFPLILLPKAKILIGLTRKVYLLDNDCRVWVHYPWNVIRKEIPWVHLNAADIESKEDFEVFDNQAARTQMRLSYVT